MEQRSEIFVLPVNIVGRIDVGRLIREVDALTNFLEQAAVRSRGDTLKLPKTSRLFDELVTLNKINVLNEPERIRLKDFLQTVHTKAPVLHISFAADPSPRFTQSLVEWLRKEIHPLVLVAIGLQPNIGAGCMVRTSNKYFDFSLRQYFKQHRDLLLAQIRGITAPSKAVVENTEANPASVETADTKAVPIEVAHE